MTTPPPTRGLMQVMPWTMPPPGGQPLSCVSIASLRGPRHPVSFLPPRNGTQPHLGQSPALVTNARLARCVLQAAVSTPCALSPREHSLALQPSDTMQGCISALSFTLSSAFISISPFLICPYSHGCRLNSMYLLPRSLCHVMSFLFVSPRLAFFLFGRNWCHQHVVWKARYLSGTCRSSIG